ncbi:DNA repair protein RecN [uncultured Duncaniella sp.]|uniref:DNA repair protein RecN n=1 Tax=uncultured Duncaniella sp. TaxID=2768039 RepID=UPI0025FFA8DE|nr:DNA repair protein RecN [uncultured Duncaniella sp.]
MLESLHISNYALIDRIDIRFHKGFNVITGETGAGKSIILGALSLILGGRADSRVVADPSCKSIIEAVFTVDGYDALKDYCLQNDIEWDDERCILRREIAPTGRSRAFINDSPVPLNRLQAVAMRLIDIHSQHQNQLLSTPEFQLMVIDTLAGNEHRLKEYTSRYNALREAVRRLKAMRLKVEKEREDEEFTRYQLEQIEELALSPGEQEELENERDVLTNLTSIKNSLESAISALTGDETNAIDLIDIAIDACDELDGVLDEKEDVPSRLESARIEISDIASTLESLNERLAADPGRLEAVEERLNSIYSLCHKHHLNNGDEILSLRDTLRAKLNDLDNSDDLVAGLEKEARRAKALAKESAIEISNSRKAEAKKFADHLRETAMPLGMKNLQVDVLVETSDMGPTGIDSVQFMVAFNKNQNLMPVGATASGGEISRLMLSIKAIIASKMSLPSILFDEIDTGVSGDVANRMALMMRDISQSLQVTAITHLPQVAAKGDTQFRVYKEDDDKSTHTRIIQLTPEQRVDAIAEMLGGATIDNAARQAAISLINS